MISSLLLLWWHSLHLQLRLSLPYALSLKRGLLRGDVREAASITAITLSTLEVEADAAGARSRSVRTGGYVTTLVCEAARITTITLTLLISIADAVGSAGSQVHALRVRELAGITTVALTTLEGVAHTDRLTSSAEVVKGSITVGATATAGTTV